VVEDLVQDFFITIWMEASRLHFGTSIKSYLFSGIKNRCLDYQKHQKVSEKYKTYLLFNSEIEDDSFEHYFAETELRQAIEKSLVKLPPRCREIFELSRASKLTNQEISDQLGISKRTVEVQISNALKIFRKELSEYLPLLLITWLIG
jgi:RNA polymerase sigma-70 factor (ECF subfamily)